MTTKSISSVSARLTLAQAFIVLTGLYYAFVGLSMLFTPVWFYENIGTFPPFNRHFIGDLGTFILPLGAGLLLAAQNPGQHRLLLWVVAGANLFHGLNHLYDSITGRVPLALWWNDTFPLIIGAVLFLLALWPEGVRKKLGPV